MPSSKSSEVCCSFDIDDCAVLPSQTRKVVFGCGNVYVTIDTVDMRPVRLFLRLGKVGCCQRSLLEAVARLVTIVFEHGNTMPRVAHTLRGIVCDKGMAGKGRKSCMDAIASELESLASELE